MSVNSSDDTPHLPSNSTLPFVNCLPFRTSMLVFTGFSITNILLILPLITLVLYLGYQRWRQQCYISTTAAASHSDIFTYHMVAMEMIIVLGCLLYLVGVNTNLPNMFTYGFYMAFATLCVKIHFLTLTCVEHYLAVVHPVTYLGLKNTGGIRIRNISIGCVWLLCFVCGILVNQSHITMKIVVLFCFAAFALIVICFCCISVLRALRRPGPGEAGREREQVNQMKQRAFNAVVTIMGVLWLGIGGMLVCNVIASSQLLSVSEKCVAKASAIWFSLPSGLVLPLLYLQRAGKLPGCKY